MRALTTACAILMVFALGAGVLAQAPGGRRGAPPRGEPGLAALKDLGLSQEQTKKISAIVRDYRMDVAAAFRSGAAPEETKNKIDALKSKAATAIEAVLTPAQKQNAKEKGLIERLLNPRARDQARLMDVLEELNLSQAQKTKITAILDDSKAKRKAIDDDKALTAEQRRAKHLELRKQTMDNVNAVLTAEQRAKLDKLLKDRGRPGPGPGGPPPASPAGKAGAKPGRK